ncbi:DNA-methyltransferase [Brucella intermedia]|uniref:DNA-methyltransferase n=1 Tax=Brucella intermedia TaxID=94625 RepID=UPI003AB789CF
MDREFSILDGRVTIIVDDCFAALSRLPDDSVDCIVTSPPYWGLRDYGVDGQIGLEPTLAEHLGAMMRVFSEVRRVLKPTGTCWVNYGDCYATTPNGRSAADVKAIGNDDRTFRDKPFSTIQGVLKHKDLCMVPNRFAIALQEAGWWIRSEIIWAKPNPMPESIRDRPATSHEKIFLITKSPRYFYDKESVRQNIAASSVSRLSQDVENQIGSSRANGGRKTNGNMKAVGRVRGHKREHVGFRDNWDHMTKEEQGANGRNLRNYEPAPVDVWNIATQPFSDAHFATFPPELAERCILAGCPKGGVVLDPFGGAGTTGLVAARHGRNAVLIELNPEYAEISKRRIEREWRVMPSSSGSADFGPLFSSEAAE